MRRLILAISLAILLVLLSIAVGQLYQVLTARPPEISQPDSSSPLCRTGNPMVGVYNPWRLRVVRHCLTVTGKVARVARMADGDFHVDIQLDAPYAGLVNNRNVAKQKGALVVEIIPADQASVHAPRVGDHVEVTGPYVLDRLHGWMEIHPAWGFSRIDP